MIKLLLPLALAALLTGCQQDCDGHVYVLAQGLAAGASVPGKMAPSALPAGFPRNQLSADGSYAGRKAYCNVNAARSDYVDSARAGRIAVPGAWSVWQTDARWPDDVHPYRPADWRLKAPARLVKEMEKHNGSGN